MSEIKQEISEIEMSEIKQETSEIEMSEDEDEIQEYSTTYHKIKTREKLSEEEIVLLEVILSTFPYLESPELIKTFPENKFEWRKSFIQTNYSHYSPKLLKIAANAFDKYGNTVLGVVAGHSGQIDAAQLLIDMGADIDVVDEFMGKQALHWAMWGSKETDEKILMVELLLKNNARTDIRCYGGTPLEYAKERKFFTCADLIEKYQYLRNLQNSEQATEEYKSDYIENPKTKQILPPLNDTIISPPLVKSDVIEKNSQEDIQIEESVDSLQMQVKPVNLVDRLIAKFEEFKLLSPDPKNDIYQRRSPESYLNYNVTRTEFSKKLYLITKAFFDTYQDELSPTDKFILFEAYTKVWRDIKGVMDIEDTDYAEQYNNTSFGKYSGSYNDRKPMLAGFNLKNIVFGKYYNSDMIFLSVDFTGADLRKADLPYSDFHYCNFIDSNLAGANLNQCRFNECNLEGVDLRKTDLCEASFEHCIMHGTQYVNKGVPGMSVYRSFKDNLFTACRDGNLTNAKQILKYFPYLLNQLVEGHTPLHAAAICGEVETMELLLKNGADIHAVNYMGREPFNEILLRMKPYNAHYSLEEFDKMVTLFVSAGLNLNGIVNGTKGYLGELAYLGALEAMKVLVAKGADIHLQDQYGNTPLFYAYFTQQEVARWLIKQGTKSSELVNIMKAKFQEYRKQSPAPEQDIYKKRSSNSVLSFNFTRTEFSKKLYLETKAFFEKHQDALSPSDKFILLKEYIQLWQDIQGVLDIQDTEYAEQYKRTSFSKYGNGYNDHVPMLAGFNLKKIAFGEFNHSDMIFLAVNFTESDFQKVKLLYCSFHDCNFTDSNLEKANFNQSLFQHCNMEGINLEQTYLENTHFVSCIMYNTTYYKDLWISNCFSDNLLTACRDGKLREAQQILKIYPNLLHHSNARGNTPLHLAVITGQIEIIEFLLKSGANIHAVNNNSIPPFCDSLLQVPPLKNIYSTESFTKLVTLFMKAGLDLNATANVSNSYLGHLASAGALDAIKILIAKGANINIQDQFGLTPLHHASCGVYKGCYEKEQEEVAKWLVSKGADKTIKTHQGEVALDFAKRFQHEGIINLLSTKPKPFFLQNLKIPLKKTNAATVANALWLSDKNADTTKAALKEFGFWAKSQNLSFDEKEVEKELSVYQMKK